MNTLWWVLGGVAAVASICATVCICALRMAAVDPTYDFTEDQES